MSLLNKTKSNTARTLHCKCDRYVGGRLLLLPGAENLLERILDRNNLNRTYKQVKRNHGASGIDGMTVKQTLP